MAIWPSAMQVVLGLPVIDNAGGKLRVTPDIINAGGAAISQLMCHDITLGSARRLGPPHGYPVVLGGVERSGVARTVKPARELARRIACQRNLRPIRNH